MTPDTASEPYTAEPPSLRTWIDSTAALGIALKSKTVCSPLNPGVANGANRRPFTNTSTLLFPRPRKFAVDAPGVKLFPEPEGISEEPVTKDKLRRASPTFV